MYPKLSIAAAIFCLTGAMAAAQGAGEITAGVGVTNFGLSIEGEYSISPNLSARGMIMGGFNLDDSFEEDGQTVAFDAEFGGVAILADHYPLGNAWRISGGIFFSNSDATGTVESTDPLVDDYAVDVAFKNEVAPLITTGAKIPFGNGWAFSGDIGVIVSSLEASSGDALDPPEQADLDDLNDTLSDVPVFPFIGLAVSYSY